MSDLSEMMQMKMLTDDDKNTGWGSGAFLWVILIFLFFLAFSGNGLFGGFNSGRGDAVAAATTLDLTQIERDVLNRANDTQKEVLQNRFDNQLAFQVLGTQLQQCCCEMKTLVIEQNQATRDLIQSQYIDGLRTDLSDAKAALSNNTQSQYILGTLGKWYSNPSVNPYTCYNGYNNGNGCCGGCYS